VLGALAGEDEREALPGTNLLIHRRPGPSCRVAAPDRGIEDSRGSGVEVLGGSMQIGHMQGLECG
jgi:hypothetical protein